ncbi:alpha/beta fold hydrolase [Goodfellowiella coeruleoviolacea]|uniref:Pimeloyl-ACP methyl ester carboxylesterase n=1 Tax=Goodfellowiella coeruleoviolacea TaxID=334858 RepID=A0AAE3GPN2_9PSEU|nr:alpha/beta hydrolase [Goodfellowiella coeruleoviolacea]MCP2169873.1 Pimeloyl-ACP methyl ester carboxylesterase [Goodfellowiella coeruleoviolacea]
MVERFVVTGAGGVRLTGLEFGGTGPGILLLHGLMCRASMWSRTARWLTRYGRVVAVDFRGHGHSDKPDSENPDGPYDRDAYLADTAAVIEQCGLGPAVVIGHSLGGLTAWQLAGRRPELVRAVVIGDMRARCGDLETGFRTWFDSWPLPFTSHSDVRDFFGAVHAGQGESFTDVMVEGPDGYRPMFSFDHALATVRAFANRDHFAELDLVTAPTLVVKGELSDVPRAEQREMAERLPAGRYAEVAGAGHVLHFDNPAGWRAAVEPFVAEVLA